MEPIFKAGDLVSFKLMSLNDRNATVGLILSVTTDGQSVPLYSVAWMYNGTRHAALVSEAELIAEVPNQWRR